MTVAGCADDHWLAAGQSLPLVRGRHIVIEADQEPCRVVLLQTAPNKNKARWFGRSGAV